MLGGKKKHCIVIGAGPAGLTLAVGLTNFGHKATLIEKKSIGGDCTNTGCIPSKALLHAASLLGPDLNATDALEYARNKSQTLSKKEHKELSEIKKLQIEIASAFIKNKTTVELTYDDGLRKTIKGDILIIAAGSTPKLIPIEGLSKKDVLTNDSLFEIKTPPKKLAIVGAGPIGVEMATAFQKLGSQVSLFEFQPAVLPGQPPKISELVEKSLTELGVQVFANHAVQSFDEKKRTLAVLDRKTDDEIIVESVDKFLIATGRQPDSKSLGLENLEIETSEAGHILVDKKGRTSVKNVWAVGDISWNKESPLPGTTNAAGALARQIISQIALPYVPASSISPIPTAVFGELEVASIGKFEPDPPETIVRIEVDMSETDRYYTDDAEVGVLIVDVEKLTGNIKAAFLAGPRSAEVISIFSLAMATDISMYKVFKHVSAYPSYAMAVNKAADIFMAQNFNNVGGSLKTLLKFKFKKIFSK